MSRQPEVTVDLVQTLAVHERVCIRPVLRTVTDTLTGDTLTVPIPCGSTRERVCPACAAKARRLRMHQCAEGWHLTHDPQPTRQPRTRAIARTGRNQTTRTSREATTWDRWREQRSARRCRSTRRRQDTPDLPRVPMDQRTTGRTFTAPDGTCTARPCSSP